jgi:hypothetical protein
MNNPIWPDAQPYDSLIFAGLAVATVIVNRRAMFSRSAGVTCVLMPGDEQALAADVPEPVGAAVVVAR